MLNAARVLIILAGLLALPAVACSTACSGMVHAAAQGREEPPAFFAVIAWASFLSSIGAIYVGARAKSLGKGWTGGLCLTFVLVFLLQLLQFNFLGLFSAGILTLATILVFVAPAEEYRGVVRVEIEPSSSPNHTVAR